MKRSIVLLLASALAFLIAGCASTGGGGAAPSGGAQVASAGGAGGEGGMRNFDLKVKCPGVHELKTHGWSDQQIMQQLNLQEGDIPACEQWAATQPKGYVPPPPPGVSPSRPTPPAPPAGAAPSNP